MSKHKDGRGKKTAREKGQKSGGHQKRKHLGSRKEGWCGERQKDSQKKTQDNDRAEKRSVERRAATEKGEKSAGKKENGEGGMGQGQYLSRKRGDLGVTFTRVGGRGNCADCKKVGSGKGIKYNKGESGVVGGTKCKTSFKEGKRLRGGGRSTIVRPRKKARKKYDIEFGKQIFLMKENSQKQGGAKTLGRGCTSHVPVGFRGHRPKGTSTLRGFYSKKRMWGKGWGIAKRSRTRLYWDRGGSDLTMSPFRKNQQRSKREEVGERENGRMSPGGGRA